MDIIIQEKNYELTIKIKNPTIVSRYKDEPDPVTEIIRAKINDALGFLLTPKQTQGQIIRLDQEYSKKILRLLKGGEIDGFKR